MKLNLQIINYVYLSLAILWSPIQVGFLNIDGKGRILFAAAILVFFLNIRHSKHFLEKDIFSKPAIFWGLWVIYSAINLQLNGYYVEIPYPFFIILKLFTPYLIMIIAAKETRRNPQKISKLFTIIFTIYAILTVTILMRGSEFYQGRYLGELGNMGPLNAIYIIFFSSLLYVQKEIKLNILVPLIVFVFVVTAIAATRKAFGAAYIMSLFLILSQFNFSVKKFVLLIIPVIGFYIGTNYAIENSSLGRRFQQGIEVGYEQNTSNIEALSLVGDRVIFYDKGWEVFKDNPATGIGLKNFKYQNYGNLSIHSEYMVQLAECGVIGSSLFLLFYFWLGKNILKQWWQNCGMVRPTIWILAGGYGAVIFINFTAWTYEFYQYFAAFGVMIGYLKSYQYENRNSLSRKSRFYRPMDRIL